MYLCENGITDRFVQYECKNISQVKNKINELTKTASVNNDWKDMCNLAKKHGCSDSCDYIYFDYYNCEADCTVCIGYDINTKSYILWIEIEF